MEYCPSIFSKGIVAYLLLDWFANENVHARSPYFEASDKQMTSIHVQYFPKSRNVSEKFLYLENVASMCDNSLFDALMSNWVDLFESPGSFIVERWSVTWMEY